MKTTDAISRHITKETIVVAVINALLNPAFAYLTSLGDSTIHIGGIMGYGTDLAFTTFIMSTIVGMIGITLNRRRVQRGALPSISLSTDKMSHRVMSRFPHHFARAALFFGVCGYFIWATPTIVALLLLNILQMPLYAYLIFKGIWAALFSIWLMPYVICFALATADNNAT